MDHFSKLRSQIRNHILGALLLTALLAGALCFTLLTIVKINLILALIIISLIVLILVLIAGFWIANRASQPLQKIWQAVWHVAPGNSNMAAPDINQVKIGRDMVAALVTQIYQQAGRSDMVSVDPKQQLLIQATDIVKHLPLPLFVFDKQQRIVAASEAAQAYCQVADQNIVGQAFYDKVNLEFSSEATLEKWILECQNNKAIDTTFWHRVHVRLADNSLRQCDLAATFNRDNSNGAEFMVMMFDRTAQYNQDDDDVGFVALAVHELRTPLTMLRGYIEVFQDEFKNKLDPELDDFMQKMTVSAQQLGAFFNNILNVARVDQNQMDLQLNRFDWRTILEPACQEIELKVRIHNQHLAVNIDLNLPAVAVDNVSIVEVINNLIDNAIKYSRQGETITVNAKLNNEGLIETTVADNGLGIPDMVLPHIFDKFYRSHRSANSVGGTGLGLYICKAIVKAHGGQIWVKSAEGKGTTFGFTLLPADRLDKELKANNNGIIRSAHGWIKNHSMYRSE